MQQEKYLPDIQAETIEDLNIWVWRHIKYKADVEQYTQPPNETLIKRAGDCEDQAALLIYLCEELLDIYPVMWTDWSIKHTMVKYDNKIYDPTIGAVK